MNSAIFRLLVEQVAHLSREPGAWARVGRALREGVAMSCPSEDCRGERAEQRELTAVQKATVDEPGWGDLAVRCSSCGCVYTLDARGRPTIKG